MNRNYLVIDTETGGLNPTKHSLLSIAIVFVKDGEIVAKNEWLIKNDIYNVTAPALRINKIDILAHDSDAKEINTVKTEIRNKIKHIFGDDKPIIMGHNVSFDIGFIHNQLFNKGELESFVSYRHVDTASIARFLYDSEQLSVENTSLSCLLEYFNIGSENSEGRHNALFDALNTYKVYDYLIAITKGMM